MSIPGAASPLFLATTGAAAAFEISRSLRFNSADSAYLNRTPSSAGNRKTWTWSGWVKKSVTGNVVSLFGVGTDSTNLDAIDYQDESLRYTRSTGGSFLSLKTNAVFRDPSAWYHVVVAVDTTQATAADRVKIYVNGTQETSFSSSSYPSQNEDTFVNSTKNHTIGRRNIHQSDYFDGYIAETALVDGSQLDPTSFGAFDANGVWQAIDTSGLTFGTNGFRLKFADNSGATATTLGKDTSGNSNNWTPNNLSADDGVTTVAQASGGTPIQVTADTFGKTLGSGINGDSNASSLTLCMPLTSQGSLSITDDVSPTGRTVSAKTITNSNAVANTTYYQYYGGSTAFNGSTSKLTTTADSDFTFGTGDFTVEAWFYQTSDNTYPTFLEIGNHLGTSGIIFLTRSSGQAKIYSGGFIGTATFALNQWNHVAWVRASGVLNIYVNGVLGSSDAFTNNLTSTAGNVTFGTTHSTSTGGYMFPGYMQDIRVYKGVAKYTGAFTVPGRNESIAIANDSLVDTPTNAAEPTDSGIGGEIVGNYATWNPLNTPSGITLSNGNLDCQLGSSGDATQLSTIGMSSGKWYAEITGVSTTGGFYNAIGLGKEGASGYLGSNAQGWGYHQDGRKIAGGGAASYGASYVQGDVIGVAFDADNGTLTFYKNGSSQGTAYTGLTSGPYFFAVGSSQTKNVANFGQRAFAYTAPSGYKSLNTANLPEPTIADGSQYFDTKLWTGNGSDNRAITGYNFSPDFAWIKVRNQSYDHNLQDVIQGTATYLSSNTTSAETAETRHVKSFDSNGFTLGTGGFVNGNNDTYVGWAWDGGTSTVTNNDGSIASSVRANPTAGFSIVSYTGTGSASSIGHNLNAAPSLILLKDRDATNSWQTFHVSVGNTKSFHLNATAGTDTASSYWNNTSPTSSVFTVGSSATTNASGRDFIAYCFAPVAGYSAMGSYTGNNSADGPFVYTGFKPRWIMIKATSFSEHWYIYDTKRKTYNVNQYPLLADSNNGGLSYEGIADGGQAIDILSNGFKIRGAWLTNNGSQNYIWAAFAEHPFASNGGLAR